MLRRRPVAARKAVVIGGGLLGLEAAAGLDARGMDVTVAAPDADADGAPARSRRRLSAAAERSRSAASRSSPRPTPRRSSANGKVEGVELDDGTRHPGDAGGDGGRHPAQRRARQGGRARRQPRHRRRRRHAHLRSRHLRRSANAPRSAAMSTAWSRRSTRWRASPPAQLAGDDAARFVHSDTPTKLKVTGIDLFSLGDFADGDDREEIVLRDAARGVYKRLVLQGQPHHRRRALRRDRRRRLVLRPDEAATSTSPRCARR